MQEDLIRDIEKLFDDILIEELERSHVTGLPETIEDRR